MQRIVTMIAAEWFASSLTQTLEKDPFDKHQLVEFQTAEGRLTTNSFEEACSIQQVILIRMNQY